MPRRRQETLWIHRWSRWMIGAIALMGAFGTAYLTVVKVMGGSAACPTAGCDLVLASPYAEVFGVPLTIFGCLGYLGMATLALSPFAINPDRQKELRRNLENWTWPLLFMGAMAMLIFSGYLMYLLAFELKAVCLYCITSALFAASMFTLTLLGRRWEDFGQLVFIGLIVSVVTLVGTLAVYAPINAPQTANSDVPGETGPPITTLSGDAEIALAAHLKDIGAKMYGAWWCPHCHDQKQLFGQDAAKTIPYIECAEDGQNPQRELCRSAGISGFPTWEIQGELYSGAQSLEVLAEASGYTGPSNFRN
ncbi:MAG: vitamin K epoxide reductase family protein [Leptolyngbya sp. SIO1D8]|nr:vitamin K epoxide reductase family protein [Leptolyngbya sp. SIO1D8]